MEQHHVQYKQSISFLIKWSTLSAEILGVEVISLSPQNCGSHQMTRPGGYVQIMINSTELGGFYSAVTTPHVPKALKLAFDVFPSIFGGREPNFEYTNEGLSWLWKRVFNQKGWVKIVEVNEHYWRKSGPKWQLDWTLKVRMQTLRDRVRSSEESLV